MKKEGILLGRPWVNERERKGKASLTSICEKRASSFGRGEPRPRMGGVTVGLKKEDIPALTKRAIKSS